MILQVSLRVQVLKSVPLRVLQGYHTVLLEYHHGLGFRLGLYPKGPCTERVYTLALKWSLYGYIGAKVCTIWVHGPLGHDRIVYYTVAYQSRLYQRASQSTILYSTVLYSTPLYYIILYCTILYYIRL